MSHTPGPWTVEHRGYKYIVSRPNEGYITRDVCRLDGSTMSALNQYANALLIAAAPDLLWLLREFREDYAFKLPGCPDPKCHVCERTKAFLTRVDQAIAKATGEPS